MKNTKIICWKFSLFGNEGAESGVEHLYSSLSEIISEYRSDKRYVQNEFGKNISIKIYEYTKIEEYINWQKKLYNYYFNTVKNNAFPLFIGGNHLSVLPIYNYHSKTKTKTLILTFDAHIDAYGSIKENLYHGNYLHHFTKSENIDIIHIGNRELILDKNDANNIIKEIYSMLYIITHGMDHLINIINEKSIEYDEIHLDIDIDVFDQSNINSTGFPIPFGLEPNLMLKFLSSINSSKVVGISITEYNYLKDSTGSSKNFLTWFIEYCLLGIIYKDSNAFKKSAYFKGI
jgi:arginase family enzyme